LIEAGGYGAGDTGDETRGRSGELGIRIRFRFAG
jgi:hypothetical protein